jgi:TPR repeat protein
MIFRALIVGCCLLVLASPAMAQVQAHLATTQSSDSVNLTARDFAELDLRPLMFKVQPQTSMVEKWVADGESGNYHAMTMAALSILRGGVETQWDWRFGHTLLMRSALAGNVRARVELARLSNFAVASTEHERVRQWLAEAAAAKFPIAERVYAEWLIEGRNGTPRDEARGLAMMRAAASRGVTDAMLYLATLQPADGPYRHYWLILWGDRPFVDQDNQDNFEKPKLSVPELARWMRAAADAGDKRGQFGMAILHKNGWGVAKDKEMEVYWHRLAAEGQHGVGRYDFARRMMIGDGVSVDRSAGFALLRELHPIPGPFEVKVTELLTPAEHDAWLIADNGHRPNYGREYQGRAYTAGRTNSRAAIPWLKMPADAGDQESMFLLGELYDRGYYSNPNDTSAQDHAQAIYWYEKAALSGFESAAVSLGRLYASGPIAYRDEIKALAWFERASDSNDRGIREWATERIDAMKRRQFIRAERERIELANAREEARFQAERARIERANAAEAAAAWQRIQARNQLQARARQFYRPNFTGYPMLDALEADRAWQSAQASARFFEQCRLNGCVAAASNSITPRRAPVSALASSRLTTAREPADRRITTDSMTARNITNTPYNATQNPRSGTPLANTAHDNSAVNNREARGTVGGSVNNSSNGQSRPTAQPALTVRTPYKQIEAPPENVREVFTPLAPPPAPRFPHPCEGKGPGCVVSDSYQSPPEQVQAYEAHQLALQETNRRNIENRRRVDAVNTERQRAYDAWSAREAQRRREHEKLN